MNYVKTIGAAALLLTSGLTALAAPSKVGILLGSASVDAANAQESAAAKWFLSEFSNGEVILPGETDKIDAAEFEAIWVHIDRVGIGAGFENLPEEFRNDEVMDALAGFVEDGGNLYVSKFATQLVAPLGRMPEKFQPGIFGDGDGGPGTDVWCVNAHLGSWQINPDNQEPDPTQIYDRRGHAAYAGLETFEAWSTWGNFPHESYPMLGTGDGTEMHREDHNCMWDLNAYDDAFKTGAGKNTLEEFESQMGCEVIGTWGHVQDYCVAGIVDFAPRGAIKGRIVANGLAACEWAPRSGVNAYHSNLEKLTGNILRYLAPSAGAGVTSVASDNGECTFYNLQGMPVARPESGIYVKVCGGKATKVLVK